MEKDLSVGLRELVLVSFFHTFSEVVEIFSRQVDVCRYSWLFGNGLSLPLLEYYSFLAGTFCLVIGFKGNSNC
jgi:hypothetical protein